MSQVEGGGNYSDSRKSQENKDFIKKIDDSLKVDGKIDNTEAKEIQDKYKKLKSNIVAITKEELSSFAEGLGLDKASSLGKTLNKLKEKSNNTEIVTEPIVGPIVPVVENIQGTEQVEGVNKSGESVKNELITKYSKEYKNLQIDITTFLNGSLNNSLKGELGDFNMVNFDNKDGKEGFSEYELEQYSQILDKAMNQMNIIGGYKDFKEQYNDINEEPSFMSWRGDIALANAIDLQEYVFGEGKKHLTDKIHDYSEEELTKMRDEKFNITDSDNMKNFLVLLGLELGDGIEDILKFIGNIPSGLVLLPRYINNRLQLTDSAIDTQSEVEAQMQNDMLLEGNPSLMLCELLGEKGVQMIKQLGEMMVSGKNGDIALLLVTIAGLLAGGAGLVKFLAKAGKMEKTAKIAGKIQNKANKVDDIVGGAGIGHITGGFSGTKSIDKGLVKLNKQPGTGIQRVVENPIIKGNKLEITLGNGERVKIGDKIFSVEKKGEDYILKNGDNSYIIKKGTESTFGPYKYKLDGNKLTIENNIKTIHSLTDQSKVAKAEKIPTIKKEQLPTTLQKVEGVSEIQDPKLIEEFSKKIYKPVLDIKNSSKIIEAEIIEPKIVENISKLDKILNNIDNLKQSFKLKGEKIPDLFSKTLEGIKNYILGLKKSIKLKRIGNFELPGGVKLKKGAIFSHSGYDFKIVKIEDTGKIIISSIPNKEDSVTAVISVRIDHFDSDMVKGINKNRYMKLRGKKSKAEGEQYIPEKKVILNKTEKLLKDFDNLPKSEHAQELLSEYPHLKPNETMEIDGKTFYFSEVIDGNSRKQVVGFIEVDGEIKTRFFYRSQSDGGWRASPGNRHEGGHSKGEDIVGYSYTTTTKLDDTIYKKLDSLKTSRYTDDISDAFLDIRTDKELENYSKYLPEFKRNKEKIEQIGKNTGKTPEDIEEEIWKMQYTLMEKYNIPKDRFGINMDAMKLETKPFDDGGKLNTFRKEGISPGEWRFSDKETILSDIRKLKYPEDFIPDFSKGPIKKPIFTEHSIVGDIRIDIFEGELNGKKVEWDMTQSIDDPDIIWISNIRLKDARLNSFGIQSEFINSGVLTNKPFEYNSSLPEGIKTGEKGYADITPILAELKPIKEYKKYLAAKKAEQLKKAA